MEQAVGNPKRGVRPERRRALFRDVMQNVREYYRSWVEFNGEDIPWLDTLQRAGVTFRQLPRLAKAGDAFGTSDGGFGILLPFDFFDRQNQNEVLLHELFHMVAPWGEGLKRDGKTRRPVNELLADRFAAEILCPMPVIAYHACNTPLAQWPEKLVSIENVLRVNRRGMFMIRFGEDRNEQPASPRAKQVICSLLDIFQAMGAESLEVLGSLAVRSDSYLTQFASSGASEDHPAWLLSRDGLYYRLGDHQALLEKLDATGVFEALERDPGEHNWSFRREIPALLLNGLFPFGGTPFVVRPLESKATPRGGSAISLDQVLIGISDRDGTLALRDNDPGRSPLLPPGDPRAYRQPETYDDWLSNLEEAFLDRPSLQIYTTFTRECRQINLVQIIIARIWQMAR